MHAGNLSFSANLSKECIKLLKGDVMRLVRYLWMMLLCLSVGLHTGCQGSNAPVPPVQQVVQDVSRYFPVDQNLLWVYEGEGNEYASFTRRVMYRRDDLVQMAEDNGGTRMAMVFRVVPEGVTKIFMIPEFYTEKNLLAESANRADQVLKAPLQVGTVWQEDQNLREVLSIDERVIVPAGTFTNVLKIRVTAKSQSGDQLLEYYAPDVGLILREFTSENNYKVSSKLKNFTRTKAG
jgi:hypothetical protein